MCELVEAVLKCKKARWMPTLCLDHHCSIQASNEVA